MEYSKNKGIFWLLTLIIILIGYLCIETITTKYSIDKKENNILTTTTTKNTHGINELKNNVVQVLNTNIGKFILSKDGYVYYKLNDNNTFNNINVLDDVGIKNNYIVDDYGNFEGYKLNIDNINSLYEINFKNNNLSNTILMLDNDGKINNLTFEINNNTLKIKFNDTFTTHKDIVSVLINKTDEETYAILVDKNGNKYNYFG